MQIMSINDILCSPVSVCKSNWTVLTMLQDVILGVNKNSRRSGGGYRNALEMPSKYPNLKVYFHSFRVNIVLLLLLLLLFAIVFSCRHNNLKCTVPNGQLFTYIYLNSFVFNVFQSTNFRKKKVFPPNPLCERFRILPKI